VRITKKIIELIILAVVLTLVIGLPLAAGTGTYPLAIIDGNSMYPYYQNGDIVYYHSVADKNNIPNGTVIVFVQDNSGSSFFDGLVRPVVIHRVVGHITQGDGQICYSTRGDNNDVNDPFLTKASNILGVEGLYIPKLGLVILFIKSPQGLIAIIGVITLVYLSMYDLKRRKDKSKEKLLGSLAKKVLNGYLSNEQFKKLELAVKYSDEIEGAQLRDRSISALADWLKNGGLDEKWKMRMVTCPKCFNIAVGIEGTGENSVAICPKCNDVKALNTTLFLNEQRLNDVLVESVDEAFSVLGYNAKEALYHKLENEYSIKKPEIPKKLEDLSLATEKIFGVGANKLDVILVKTFKKNLFFVCDVKTESKPFQEFVKEVKENIDKYEDKACDENMLMKIADNACIKSLNE
jgi:signal peptidase I